MAGSQDPPPSDWGDPTDWQQQQPGGYPPPPSGGAGQPPPAGPPPGSYPPPPGAGQYGQPPYGQQQYGQQPYGQPQYGQPQYGQQGQWQGGPPPSIQTYLVPAILVTLFCFLPTGIAAIVFASQVNSKRSAGDYAGAQASSRKARLWTIVSLVVGIVVIIIYVIAAAASHNTNTG
jgi:hypothetical protein